MNYVRTTPNDILLKYGPNDLELTWEYIGENRIHGDGYLTDQYAWYEALLEDGGDYEIGKPAAVFCLTENRYLYHSLHLSCLETFIEFRGRGVGGIIMTDLDGIARDMKYRSITLQTHNDELIKFYSKFGYKSRKLDGISIMRKYV